MRTQLRPGEQKILETRTHWMTVVKPFLAFLVTFVLFIIAFFKLKSGTGIVTVVRWASVVLLIVGCLYFLYKEWYRRRNIWAVTTMRVIDEEGIFDHFSKESPLEKINNLSYFQPLFGRILNYGEIEIQTAAEDGATVYKMVTNPKLLKDTVAHQRDEYAKQAQKSGGDIKK
jgi:uncharacterized membrane protein YdbT with pleckstrin-like domain